MADRPRTVNDETPNPHTGRRVGYVIAILVNALALFLVNNILAWDILPWLTNEFERVLPIMNASIIATMIVNTMFLAYNEEWFTTLCEILTLGLNLAVAIQMWIVFPFDFTGYAWDWDAIARLAIGVAMVGITIAIIVNVVSLIRIVARATTVHQHVRE